MNLSEQAIPLILKHEGGYVNHPSDPGGATNKGITLATFRRYIKPNGTIEDLKRLTIPQAVVVYKRQYWDAVLADLLPAGLDYAVADFAVNSGPARAAKSLQALVGVPQDGKIGPRTLEAVAKHDPAKLINALCDSRLAFMRRAKNPKTGELLWPTFKNGWTARVSDVRAVSLSWASKPRPTVQTPPATKKPGAGTGAKVGAGGLALIGAAILAWWADLATWLNGF